MIATSWRQPSIATRHAIVTFNLKDFPPEVLAKYAIEPQHPDDFVYHQFGINEATVLNAARRCRKRLKNPPRDANEYLLALERCGLPQSVDRFARLFGSYLAIRFGRRFTTFFFPALWDASLCGFGFILSIRFKTSSRDGLSCFSVKLCPRLRGKAGLLLQILRGSSDSASSRHHHYPVSWRCRFLRSRKCGTGNPFAKRTGPRIRPRWRSRLTRGPGEPFHKVGRLKHPAPSIRAFYPSRSKARTPSKALPVHPGVGFVLLQDSIASV